MKIIEHSSTTEHEHRDRFFEWVDTPGAGFGFDCDDEGCVLSESESYRKCLDRCCSGEMADRGVRRWTTWGKRPAVGECVCGELVILSGFTNTCPCGRDYNWAGQELAHRSQWGEETGEHLSDILRIP